MLKILRVGIVGDDMLDVQLNNGNILMLEITSLMDKPTFAHLGEDDRILYPKTDGNFVYWRDGPRISVDDIMKLMQSEKPDA
ncbi:MAG TPA: hypothetical protein VN608_07735 [Clostridia bacterium]|nr:hypothetical protein [Clostridia bacterium]